MDNVRNRTALTLLVGIPSAFLLALFVVPMLTMFLATFYRFDPTAGVVREISLTNYVRFFSDGYYLEVLAQTAVISGIVVLISLVLGYPAAMLLLRLQGMGRMIFIGLLLLPLLTSAVVVTYGWLILLGRGGFVNQVLQDIGLIRAPLQFMYTKLGVVIGLVHVVLSFMTLSIASSLQRIDDKLIWAAHSLGASPFMVFRKIIWPLSLPGVVAGSMLVFALSMSAYATPVLIGGARVKVMSYLIYQQQMVLYDLPFGATLAVILMVTTSVALGFATLRATRGGILS